MRLQFGIRVPCPHGWVAWPEPQTACRRVARRATTRAFSADGLGKRSKILELQPRRAVAKPWVSGVVIPRVS
jgi:hypothetical protein